MTTSQKAEQSAQHIQTILDKFWKANSENARYRSELATLQGKLRTTESLLAEKERRLILLTELLHRRGLPESELEPERVETEVQA